MCRAPSRAAFAIASLCAAAVSAQEQPPFRAGVQLVEVDARVFDGDGRFVTDLTREEFELLEDGVRQELQTVYLVDGRTARTPERTGTGGAAAAGEAPAPKQTWVFIFDLPHLAPGSGFDRARAAVERFIAERVHDGDLAGIVAGGRMLNNRLTTVREELLTAVRTLRPAPEARSRLIELTREWPRLQDEEEAARIANDERSALERAIVRACGDDPGACRQAPPDLAIMQKARRLHADAQRSAAGTLTALNALASGLGRIPGPKTLVLLTEGFAARNLEAMLQGVGGRTARAGARIYSVDVRGLNRGRGGAIIDQAAADDPAGAPAGFDALEDAPNSLAVDTGGLMLRNENDIGRALARIADDTNRYYVLGYQPSNARFDGAFRSIEVRVARGGHRVRARRGYLAVPLAPPPPDKSAPAPVPHVSPRVSVEPRPPSVEPGPPATAAGTRTAPVPSAVAGATRLRPDVETRVATLSAADRGPGGELARRGWTAYQEGNVEAALPLLEAAAAGSAARPWVLYVLGLSQAAVGRPADAARSWERVRNAAPDFEPVYIDLADTYVQLAETSRALAVLRDAERRWPDAPDVHNAVGVIHVRRGALDQAVAAFERAARAAPDEPLAYFNLGRAHELRYARGRRYVSSQRRWTAPEGERRKAIERYQQYLRLGGPYADQARESLRRLEWGGA